MKAKAKNDAEATTIITRDAGANCTTNDGGFPPNDHAYIFVYASWGGYLFCYKHGAIDHSPGFNTWSFRKNKWLIQFMH